MNACTLATTTIFFAAAALPAAAPKSTDTDRAFVAKVSQGGAYEVAASRIAERRAQAQDVKDLAATEVHDHTLVGTKLKSTYTAAGLTFPVILNTEFQQRLAKLATAPTAGFDAAYVDDMKQIHDKDEKLFAQEAKDGSGDFKSFAAETDRIVKRHIGSLNAE
jgi:putative membrane protein